MSFRDWYYCQGCEVYGQGSECWCCGSDALHRASLPNLDDRVLLFDRVAAALDRLQSRAVSNDGSGSVGRELPRVDRRCGRTPISPPTAPVRRAAIAVVPGPMKGSSTGAASVG